MKRNGFTLLELLIGISLISVVMIFLFRLINDVQNEGLSNTYIVSNQTNRNEIMKILNTISYENGDICAFSLDKKPLETSFVMTFCNNIEATVTVKQTELNINYKSKKYRYVMKDETAYYNTNVTYNKISYGSHKMFKINIVTNKKGLKSTIIDDIEIISSGNPSVSYSMAEDNSVVNIFDFDGTTSQYNVPYTGIYKLEVWGAAGGYGTNASRGGYGAYSVGYFDLSQGDTLFVSVGGQGIEMQGGWNGGGNGGSGNDQWGYGGGGATHIATQSGTLETLADKKYSVLIVAGGGGGSGGHDTSAYASSGGGFQTKPGYDGHHNSNTGYNGTGANQSQGGYAYNCGTGSRAGFGKGANYCNSGYGGAGGGGGYYGGGSSNRGHGGAAGGSGYFDPTTANNAAMYCFDCDESSDEATFTVSVTCVEEEPTPNCAKYGDGYARITRLS